MGPHPKRKLIALPKPIARASTHTQSAQPPIPAPAGLAAPAAPVAPQPVAIAIATKTARRVAREAALAWLAATYPKAFGPEIKPLAIGVGKQVWPLAKEAGIKRAAFNSALKFHTTSFRYLDALAAGGAMRVDPAGQAVEPVTPEHRRRALEMKTELDQVKRARAEARKGPRP